MPTADRRLMKQAQRSVTVSFLTLAVWLCGCSGVSVKGTWQDGASRHQTYKRLLVIGVSPNRDLRCAFESTFGSQLVSASTTVISSCDQMKANEPLNRENVERVVASVQADAVLATSLISSAYGHGQGSTNDMRGDSVYKVDDFNFAYGAYGMPVATLDFQTAPPLTSITSSLNVVTKFYDTRGAKLVYTIDTVTKSQEIDSTADTLMTIAAPTADRLRRDGLIR
jgi:hypothetical protein